jgi:integral membrane sensor domain MASE1
MNSFSRTTASSAAEAARAAHGIPGAPASAPLPAPARPRDIGVLASGGGSKLRLALRALSFAMLYFVAMVLAIVLARFGGQVAPIWIASAVLAWGLITAPTNEWLPVIGLTAVAHVIGGVIVGDQAALEAVYLLANLVSPLLCAALLRWRGADLEFEDRGDVIRFLAIAGIVAPGASAAIIGAWSQISTGVFNARDTGVWFLSDGLSLVVFLPIFKNLADGGLRNLFSARLRAKAAVMFGGLLTMHAVGWFLPSDLYRFFLLFLIIYTIYIAFELGLDGARAAIGLTAVILVVYALSPAPSGRGTEPLEFLFAIQVFTAAMVASVLPLAGALAEKDRLYQTASESLAEAQAAWGDLIAAEAHYRLVADNTADMILRLDLDGAILFASPACSALSDNPDGPTHRQFADLAHPDDSARIRDALAGFAAAGAPDQPHAIQARLANVSGAWPLFDIHVTLVSGRSGGTGEFIAVLRRAGA